MGLFVGVLGVVVLLIGFQQVNSCSSLQEIFRECSRTLGYSLEGVGGILIAGGFAVLAVVLVVSKKP